MAEINFSNEAYFKTLNGLWKGKKPPFVKAGVIRNTNFTKNGLIDLSDVAYLNVEEKQLKTRQLEFGDIIVERSGGGPTQPVGRVVFFDLIDGTYSFSNFTSTIRVVDKNKIFPKYAFYNLLHFYFSGETNTLQARTTGIRNLNFTRYLETAKIELLPFTEQKNIASILSNLQSAIAAQTKIIRATTELKKTLMNELFAKGLRGEKQKETEIGLMPGGWSVKRIDEVFRFTNKTAALDLDKFRTIPFIPMEMIPDDMVYIEKYKNRKREEISSGVFFENGDLLVAKITPSFENGKQAIVRIDKDFGYATTEVIPIKDIQDTSDKLYLFYFLQKPEIRSKLASKMEGSTGRQRLSKSVLSEQKIPLPEIGEQKEISSIFEKLDEKILVSKLKKNKLTVLFQTTLHELMTGMVSVKEVDFGFKNEARI